MKYKVFELFKSIMICITICFMFVLILTMIIASKIYTDGNSGNKVIDYLLQGVSIQTVVTNDKWIEEYPFDKTQLDSYRDKVTAFEKSIESFCTSSIPFQKTIAAYANIFKERVYHYNADELESSHQNEKYIQQSVDNVVEFKHNLEEMGYPFFYVQTPSVEGIKFYTKGKKSQIAERSYALTSKLEGLGVDLINIARDHAEGIEFDASKHWFMKDAKNCAYIISDKLNSAYGFDIDLSVYDDSNFRDYLDNYPEIKKQIKENCEYDYSMPVPNDSKPSFTLTYAELSKVSGTFTEALINTEDAWNVKGNAYHDMVKINNSLIYEAENSEASAKKKLLIIGDSFNWPVASYLSLGIEDVIVLHNASFTGSIMSFIQKYDPDMVIIVYNDAEFYDVYTEAAYDFK